MKALIYHGPGHRSWEDATDPQVTAATDAIVRVDAVTICGTDLHILKGDVPAVEPGRILGHEAVGTVMTTQWLYLAYLAAIKEQNGAAMSLGRTSTFVDIYLERDLAEGSITEREVQELVGDRATDDLLADTDLVLLDIKASDPATHRRVTGGPLEPALRFARRLAALSRPTWIRFVLVPGLTDDPAKDTRGPAACWAADWRVAGLLMPKAWVGPPTTSSATSSPMDAGAEPT